MALHYAKVRMGFEHERLLPRYSWWKAVRSAGRETLAEISELTPYIDDDGDSRAQSGPSEAQLEALARSLTNTLCFALRACGELAWEATLMNTITWRICALTASVAVGVLVACVHVATKTDGSWDPKAAAGYLDRRENQWMTWPSAARDHGTHCVSCHTTMPYALARPALQATLTEQTPSSDERKLIDNVTKRVKLWKDVQPYYGTMPAQSRGTEAVLNALILASYDAQSGQLTTDARAAFDHMWETQLTAGDERGAWPWIQFDNEPWEAPDSSFYGACLAAVAVGLAPENYRLTPEIQDNLKILRDYLNRQTAAQTPINRVALLWASAKLRGLLTTAQQQSIVDEALSKQRADGGWSLSSLVGTWQRYDGTPLVADSDGYATGLIVFALEQMGISREDEHVERGLSWLVRNQSRWGGQWTAHSLNRRRYNPFSNVARFMDDAATAYAVLALTEDGRSLSRIEVRSRNFAIR